MARPATWRPVLQGQSRDKARAAVDAVISDLLADAGPFEAIERRSNDAFITLLLVEAARETQRSELLDKALGRLDDAIERLAGSVVRPALHGGYSGVGWLTMWLPKNVPTRANLYAAPEPEIDEDPCVEVDQSLAEGLAAWEGDYDLISGVVGFGVYALERLPSPSAVNLLQLIVEHLDTSASRMPSGTTWFTALNRVPAHQRREAPSGYYNLGVAHGVPGVIGFLAHVCRAGVAVDRARPLLEGAVSWLIEQQERSGTSHGYPIWAVPGKTLPAVTRTAWCYGALGLSLTLLMASQLVSNEQWEREALRLALLESERSVHQSDIRDACLCHGAAGNALLFHRLYHATLDERFFAAAKKWYERTLEMRTPGVGIGGFRFWRSVKRGDPSSPLAFLDDGSFLSGSAGVGLALLAGISASEPSWDRLLLSDVQRNPDERF